jgi:uncharacterized protein
MDYSIDIEFEKRCLNKVKQQVLTYTKEQKVQIFLFGSRANGKFRRGSDIDIGIEGMSNEQFEDIKMRMNLYWEDSIVPYHLDIVNFDHVSRKFYNIAKKRIEIWKSL